MDELRREDLWCGSRVEHCGLNIEGGALRGLELKRSCMERGLNQNLSGDEFYCTACSVLVILKNVGGEPHCQKGFHLNPVSYKIARHPHYLRRLHGPSPLLLLYYSQA